MSEQREKTGGKTGEKIPHAPGKTEPTWDQERGEEQHPTMPPGRSDLALKRYENLHEKQDEHKEHRLQERAKERAEHPNEMNVGTPYDWEELEDYKKELDRLEREGPKLRNP